MPELKPLELQSSALQTLICGQVCLALPETPSSFFILIVLLFFYLSISCVLLWGGGILTEVCSPTLTVGSNSGHQALGLGGKHAAC